MLRGAPARLFLFDVAIDTWLLLDARSHPGLGPDPTSGLARNYTEPSWEQPIIRARDKQPWLSQ